MVYFGVDRFMAQAPGFLKKGALIYGKTAVTAVFLLVAGMGAVQPEKVSSRMQPVTELTRKSIQRKVRSGR